MTIRNEEEAKIVFGCALACVFLLALALLQGCVTICHDSQYHGQNFVRRCQEVCRGR